METVSWLNLVLEVPAELAERSTRFWSAATGWDPGTADAGEVDLVPEAGDPLLKVRARDDVTGPSIAVEALGGGPWPGRSPGGLRVRPAPDGRARRFARAGVRSLDQVCVDIPAAWWDAETRFWAGLTGRRLEHGNRPEFALLADPDPAGGLRILLQRLDTDEPRVRAHPDFAVADRPAETDRHVALGAQQVAVMEPWTVMRAPDGHVYCLTDRDPATGSGVRRHG